MSELSPMLRRGVTKPHTQTGADGTITIQPRKVWLAHVRQLAQSGDTVAADFIEWEAQLFGPEPQRRKPNRSGPNE
jgi:hypothetical protein